MPEMVEGSLERAVFIVFFAFYFHLKNFLGFFFLCMNNFQYNTDICLIQSEILFFFHETDKQCMWKGMEMAKIFFRV